MPTFRNDTQRMIDHECLIQSPTERPRKILIRFAPGETKKLTFWIPYQEKGLTLVDANDPKVPNTILVSGTFDFAPGVERRFNLERCDTYNINIIVQKGRLMLFPASANVGVEIAQEADIPYHYRAVFDWEHAPYIRVSGLDAGTRATVHAEVDRGSMVRGIREAF
ncbi:MAG: hypothetical protein IJR68_04765 [Fretibacterium sp.]|nr:hypothetical protein [Fretibacterium sp.]